MTNSLNERYFNAKIGKNMHKKTLIQYFEYYGVANNKIKYFFNNQCCYVNGELYQDNQLLKINDYLTIDISNFEKLDYLADDVNLKIIYEDEYLLVINKPTGHIIYPENNLGHGTIVNMVANFYQKNDLNITVRHCHRLDKDTSGCLVFAKDVITHSAMCKLFENHQIEKTYWAYVEGIVEKPGIINYAIGKDRHINGKMVVYAGGKKAKTTYKPLSNKNNRTLVEVKIDTGRTHQIRVHMATIGHPLVGDVLYGAKSTGRVMLHCKTLSFIHPITGEKLYIESPISDDFKK